MVRRFLVIVAVLTAGVWYAWAESADPKPAQPAANAAKPDKAETPSTEKPLTAKVVSVTGTASRRDASDEKATWQAVKVGDVLGEKTLIRTGLGSQVVLEMADRGQVKIGSGSKVGLGEFRKEGDLAHTRLGLKYGSMKAKVDRSHGPNDFRVSTPVATLSVRGSAGSIGYSGDFGMSFNSTQSSWHISTAQGSGNYGAGEHTNGNLTPSNQILGQALDTQMGDPSGGLSGNEQQNLMNNGGGRGILGFTGGNSSSPNLNPPPGLGESVCRDVPIPIPPGPHCGTVCP